MPSATRSECAGDRREVVTASVGHLPAGASWERRPLGAPPDEAAFHHSRRGRSAGVRGRANDRPREDGRAEAGCPPLPATGRMDDQAGTPTRTRGDPGYDGGTQVPGRNRFVLTGSLGLLRAVRVMTAAVQDRDGRWLLRTFHRPLRRTPGVGSAGESATGSATTCGGGRPSPVGSRCRCGWCSSRPHGLHSRFRCGPVWRCPSTSAASGWPPPPRGP